MQSMYSAAPANWAIFIRFFFSYLIIFFFLQTRGRNYDCMDFKKCQKSRLILSTCVSFQPICVIFKNIRAAA